MHPSHLLQEAFRTPQAGDMSPTPTLTPRVVAASLSLRSPHWIPQPDFKPVSQVGLNFLEGKGGTRSTFLVSVAHPGQAHEGTIHLDTTDPQLHFQQSALSHPCMAARRTRMFIGCLKCIRGFIKYTSKVSLNTFKRN